MAPLEPNLDFERQLLTSGFDLVIGCDEVGRGAIAGPVAVGLCAVDRSRVELTAPNGVRDSKLLSPQKRQALYPVVQSWALACSVGMIDAKRIDEVGINQALAEAALVAIAGLNVEWGEPSKVAVILDGKHDWLSSMLATGISVQTKVKADRECVSVAAASVIAKFDRDRLMILEHSRQPEYGWQSNKGYGSKAHFDAIEHVGSTDLHRLTWIGNRDLHS